MLVALYLLNSLTTNNYQDFRNAGSVSKMQPNSSWRPRRNDDWNEDFIEERECPAGVTETLVERIVTFISDHGRQITFDLRLRGYNCLKTMLELVDQVKTENSKLFYNENEIKEQLKHYEDLLKDENCSSEIKHNIKKQKKNYSNFTSAKANEQCMDFLSNMLMVCMCLNKNSKIN